MENQTKGRGRRKQRWFSNPIGSLTFSLLLSFKLNFKHLSGLSLLISLCLVRVFAKLAPAEYRIKWPNDILFNERKISGILIESKSDIYRGVSVIIGVGVNVKLPKQFVSNIEYPITDLYQITARRLNRNQLLAHFLIELYQLLNIFRIKGFEPFREEWMQLHYYHNKPVELRLPDKKTIVGVVAGVTSEGQLILKTVNGLQNFAIGDISLRSKISG